jgi:hypothetical protein
MIQYSISTNTPPSEIRVCTFIFWLLFLLGSPVLGFTQNLTSETPDKSHPFFSTLESPRLSNNSEISVLLERIDRLEQTLYDRNLVSQSRLLATPEIEPFENTLSYDGESHNNAEQQCNGSSLQPLPTWLDYVRVGYDGGFVIASEADLDIETSDTPFQLKMNGWGQIRHTILESDGSNADLNQFQLKRARLIFSGTAFTPDFNFFIQLDGRSSSGDNLRLLDYLLTFDIGHQYWGLEKGILGFKTGKYKMPFTMARYMSGRDFEFSDRSMASMFFDVNRSLAWGLYGKTNSGERPVHWEVALFNGLVTGGAETGSSGTLDENFAYSGRIFTFPTGDWGEESHADFKGHDTLASRIGAGFANSTIDRSGSTEFSSLRVVDSGLQLSNLLPFNVKEYDTYIYSLDAACKHQGWSATMEYYFRSIQSFHGAEVPNLFDHGFWLQFGKFIIPKKLQLITRWSRVVGNSGTLGINNQSSEEIAGGFVWYLRNQHSKITVDATHLNGAPINSSALDISPGDSGWLFRSQIQFAF